LYDFCKRKEEKKEEIKKMTKEERYNLTEEQYLNVYAKRKYGTILYNYEDAPGTSEFLKEIKFLNTDIEIDIKIGKNGYASTTTLEKIKTLNFDLYACFSKVPETTRWELLFELEVWEYFGPTLDVFLFLQESGKPYFWLQNLQKVSFEKMYSLSIGRDLIKHTEEFDGIQVKEKTLRTEKYFFFQIAEVKIGKLEKFQDIKDLKYPRKYLIKRIENLLKKVEKGLEYPEKNLEEEKFYNSKTLSPFRNKKCFSKTKKKW
jgi:hypothetical protein